MATNKDKIRAAAQKYLQKGQLDKAIREFQRLVEEDPKDVRTLLKIGDLQTRKGEHEEATQTYGKVAQFYSDQGFFLKAVAVYKQILKLAPTLLDINRKLGDLYHQLGLVSDATQQYRQLCDLLEKAGRSDEVIEMLAKMVELDPDNLASRIKLAETQVKQGLLTEAKKGFQHVAEQFKAQHRMVDYAKVSERLVQLDPGDLAMSRELAAIYIQQGDARRALAKLQICFRADPKDVETLSLLATAFGELQQLDKTLSVLRELAKIQHGKGDTSGYAATRRKILELSPHEPDMLASPKPQTSPNAASASAVERAAPAAVALPSQHSAAPPPAQPTTPPVARSAPPPAASAAPAAPVVTMAPPVASGPRDDADLVYGKPASAPSAHPSAGIDDEGAVIAEVSEADLVEGGGENDFGAVEVEAYTGAEIDVDAVGDVILGGDESNDLSIEEASQAPMSEHAGILHDAYHNDLQSALAAQQPHSPRASHPTSTTKAAPQGDFELELDTSDSNATSSPRKSAFQIRSNEELLQETGLSLEGENEQPRPTRVSAVPSTPAAPITLATPTRSTEPATFQDLTDEVEEIEFFVQQGLEDEARDSLDALLAQHPNHPALLRLDARLRPQQRTMAEAAQVPGVRDPSPPKVEHFGEESLDLALELADELDAAAKDDTSQVSFDDVFDEFKKGVAREVEDTDHDTHYNLGIAYKEMGLLDDAIGAFQLSSLSPEREIASLTMIGICYLAKNAMEEALEAFLNGLNSERVTNLEVVALRYEIGSAYESMDRLGDAVKFYRKAHAMDPDFRDVAARLNHCESELGDNEAPEDLNHELDLLLQDDPPAPRAAGNKGKISYL